MGIYSTSAVFGGLDTNAAVVPALESANYQAMAIQAVAESQANYNKIMMAIGETELGYFEENGHEIVYEAGAVAGFIAKAKEFFQKLWDKIKEIFHKFFAWLDSLTKDSKEFAKKYAAEARKRWDKVKEEFSVKGYKFTNLTTIDFDTVSDNALSAVEGKIGVSTLNLDNLANLKKDEIAKMNKAISDSEYKDTIRASVAKDIVKSKDAAMTGDEFTKALREGFRNGESSPETLEKSDIDLEQYLSELQSYNEAKKLANTAYNTFKKTIDATIKDLEKLDKEVNKMKDVKDADGNQILGELTSLTSKAVSIAKDIKEVCTEANGAYLQALKDRSTQQKKVIAAIITTGKINNESASVQESAGSTSTMDFLAGVVLK